ncbi:hypothetical protein SEVIR_1G265700v4 [Setaria viridis]|uniref:C2H2-type domain-containing protein n=3 Tax=Setaria TaxID=4554 RepID=K3Z0F4_SETIT|nr:zinc finger protein ZAT1 [Setaria italica]XP_034569386.1 zinc finger protein ZAT1-like [Setaria viridis]RCV07640.1 hypothetical protein SETIT_1G261300v2 [Setaria italica]TKW40743.1 hypothetical protein SEVIR_1G265700v2 [Setaria viridis]
MAKTTCKQCYRRFASPRALAGHMRSHSIAAAQAAAAADAAAAAAVKQQISSASSASTSFAAADEDSGFKMPASTYGLRENPKRSLRVADAAFSDHESEAESTPPHAKRVNAAAAWGEAEPVSSLSEVATPEEDVALSLMMLSRDSWPSGAFDGDDYSDDGSDDGYAPPAPLPPARAPARAPVEKRTQFQCVACKKVFRSYQALGGHRASNVRGGRGGCCAPPVAPPPPPQPQPPVPLPFPEHHDGDGDMDAKQQPRECPHCYRVFASGQALGGHKRSHVCGAAAAQASTATATATAAASTSSAAPPSPINNPGMIDLNVAPPSEEVELSAVSDPRFNPVA